MRVEVVGFEEPVVLDLTRYFVSLLRQLGYRSSTRLLPGFVEYYEYVADSRNKVQIGSTGWQADTLAPSNFLRLFTCDSFIPNSPANENLVQYCDEGLDAKIKEAVGSKRPIPYASQRALGRSRPCTRRSSGGAAMEQPARQGAPLQAGRQLPKPSSLGDAARPAVGEVGEQVPSPPIAPSRAESCESW